MASLFKKIYKCLNINSRWKDTPLKILLKNHIVEVSFILLIFGICCFRSELKVVDCTYCNWFIYIIGGIVFFSLLCIKAFKVSLIKTPSPLILLLLAIPICFIGISNNEALIVYITTVLWIFVFINIEVAHKVFCITLFTIGLISSIICCVQIVSHSDIVGLSSHVNELALILTLSIISGLWLLKRCSKLRIKLMLIVSILLCILILLFVGSRTGLLACSMAGMFLIKDNKYKLSFLFGAIILVIAVSLGAIKMNSTIGRTFIYQTSLSLLKSYESILLGLGYNGFDLGYMQEQANKLSTSSFEVRQLAANIKHPLNEFILILIRFGIIGLISTIGYLYFVFKHSDNIGRAILAVIAVFASFTYPIYYPITFLTLVYVASKSSSRYLKIIKLRKYGMTFYVLITSLIVIYSLKLSYTLYVGYSNWIKGYNYTNLGIFGVAEKHYKEAVKFIDSPNLWYNYAYFELLRGNSSEGIILLRECSCYDYDVAMLKANLLSESNLKKEAIFEFKNASNMCPNRFQPLFGQYKIYEELDHCKEADSLRNVILNKPIKVYSEEIRDILNYVSCIN